MMARVWYSVTFGKGKSLLQYLLIFLLALFGCDSNTFNYILEGISEDLKKSSVVELKQKVAAVFMCLKLGNSYEAIAALHNIHPTTLANWFADVIEAAAKLSVPTITWWSKAQVQSTMPESCRYIKLRD